ncbi:Serine/threonine-protein kinase/endoribonuclease IRE2 [Nosema granulosis]|uniref:Serine/threonine-protein kinase/endoribonuclease IRE2 n=1 Tax=Nosema granulosis TaxID=83296 RepID=A0A9P6H0C4_9MICR|nr:Serine/threonine-protein kinase/endoribonuclease IRE2 [Nosema granulosis]
MIFPTEAIVTAIILLPFVNSLYIIQTNNSSLHFILNDKIHEVKIPLRPRKLLEIPGDFVKSDTTDVVLSSRQYIHNILVTSDGNIFIEGQSFNIDSIIDKPKIINNIVFQTQKRCATAQLFDIMIFIVFLDLNIIDSRTMCKRVQRFSYIYYPFSSTKEIDVRGHTVTIEGKIYRFPEDVIAVYNTKNIDGVNYMNRIYCSTQISIYQPRIQQKSPSVFYFISIPLILFLIWIFKRKHVKFYDKIDENELYILYEGSYVNKRVLIKWYKKYTSEVSNEVRRLYKMDCAHISKLLYHENSIFHTFLVFEYSDILIRPTKDMLKQIVLGVKYLHDLKIPYKFFNPSNIRIRNGNVVLFNVCSPWIRQIGWYSEEHDEEDVFMRDVLSLGCLLHYYITGYHPFDLRGTMMDENTKKFIKAPCFDANTDEIRLNPIMDEVCDTISWQKYTNEDLERININISLRRYKIRCEDQLAHDLIYHTVKNKIKDRTNIHKLSVHPYFWNASTVFEFIAHYSDILEGSPTEVKKLERNKGRIFERSWNLYLDRMIEDELSVFRIYNYNSAKDLVRVIRNKGRHYNQIPNCVKEIYTSFPEGFISYWSNLFPGLLIVCYNCGYYMKENELLEKFY